MPLHFTDDAYSDDDDVKIGKIIFSDTESDNDSDFMHKIANLSESDDDDFAVQVPSPKPSTSKGKIDFKVINFKNVIFHLMCCPHCSKSSFFVQKFNFDFPRKLSIFCRPVAYLGFLWENDKSSIVH